MRSQPPFTCEIQLPEVLNDVRVKVVCSVQSETQCTSLREVVELFSEAVRLRLFGDESAPAKWIELDWSFEHGKLTHVATVSGVRARSFRSLVQMLAQCKHFGDPISKLQIVAGTEESIVAEHVTESPHPKPRLDVPTESYGRRVLLELTFGQQLDEDLAEEIAEILHVWDHLVFMGAYDSTYVAQEEFYPAVGETFLSDDKQIVHEIGLFLSENCAFTGVENLIAALSDRLDLLDCRITSGPIFSPG